MQIVLQVVCIVSENAQAVRQFAHRDRALYTPAVCHHLAHQRDIALFFLEADRTVVGMEIPDHIPVSELLEKILGHEERSIRFGETVLLEKFRDGTPDQFADSLPPGDPVFSEFFINDLIERLPGRVESLNAVSRQVPVADADHFRVFTDIRDVVFRHMIHAMQFLERDALTSAVFNGFENLFRACRRAVLGHACMHLGARSGNPFDVSNLLFAL